MKLERYIMRLTEVEKATGYKRASIYKKMKSGEFPQCVNIGERAVGWNSSEIQAWIDEKLGQND